MNDPFRLFKNISESPLTGCLVSTDLTYHTIGSSNYNSRSSNLDLECNATIDFNDDSMAGVKEWKIDVAKEWRKAEVECSSVGKRNEPKWREIVYESLLYFL